MVIELKRHQINQKKSKNTWTLNVAYVTLSFFVIFLNCSTAHTILITQTETHSIIFLLHTPPFGAPSQLILAQRLEYTHTHTHTIAVLTHTHTHTQRVKTQIPTKLSLYFSWYSLPPPRDSHPLPSLNFLSFLH